MQGEKSKGTILAGKAFEMEGLVRRGTCKPNCPNPWLTVITWPGVPRLPGYSRANRAMFVPKLGPMVDLRSVSVRFGSPRVLRVIPIEARVRGRGALAGPAGGY